jgi:hypothetical protein
VNAVATTFAEVSTYRVFSYGGPQGNRGADATVSLGIPDGWAILRFYPDGADLPPNHITTHVSGKPIYYVSYRYSQLGNIVDLLRYEKPIRFFFRDDTLAAYLTTASEPVGEEELA